MKCNECGKEMKLVTGKPYHYTESGLDNIYLADIPVHRCTCGETAVEVPNVEELHTIIAGGLLRDPRLLVGKEIKFLRKQMKLKAVELANQLGINTVTLSRWENNTESIGQANDKLLKLVFVFYYIKDLTEKGLISPKLMRKYVEFASQIATMRQGTQKRRRIQLSEAAIQRVPETELLLTGIA